jgi:ribonuclease III
VDGVSHGAAALALRLEHGFSDPGLLHQALAHRSWCGEQDGEPSNERLEFLGDAVLGVVVAEHSYRRFPDFPEGKLAKLRAAVVNARVLAEVAEGLGIGEVLLLGRGEESSGGRTKASILADALEAVIGAVYLDAGWDAARPLVVRLLGDRIERAAAEPDDFDHKSRLQELTVHRGEGTPHYVVRGSGPDHDRHYVAEVFVNGERRGAGEGTSKKDAEQEAARTAWQELHDG